jgi:predicted permease
MRLPWRRKVSDRDLDDEIRAHLAIEAEERIASGDTPDEAAHAARRAFGNVALIKEDTRSVWQRGWFDAGRKDVRFALRAIRRTPGFTLVVVLTLALGIGANTAIFSVIHAIFFEPLAVTDPGRLVLFSPDPFYGTMTNTTPRDGAWREYSSASYEYLRDAGLPLAGVAASAGNGSDSITWHRLGPNGASDAAAPSPARADARGRAHLVSGNYFDVIGARPQLGRALTANDDRPDAAPVAVVSDRFWRTKLDARPSAVGDALALNSMTVTVVGVMPASFFGDRVHSAPDMWVPLVWQPAVQLREVLRDDTTQYWLNLIGRLAPGVTQPQAQVAATAALRQFLTAQAGTADAVAQARIAQTRIDIASGARGISDARKTNATPLALLFGAVGLVLLVACANVATLLLSRATTRASEVALRRALGASRGRLVRQWLTESLLLAALGAGVGLLIALWLTPAFEARFPVGPLHARLHAPVLLFTVAITVVASVLFGLAPALRAGRIDPLAALRSSGRGSRARRRAFGATEPFVIIELAISLVLVVGATLFGRTLVNLERVPLGFDQQDILTVAINPRQAGYTPDNAPALYRRLYDRVAALPGVHSVTFARYSPFGGSLSQFSGAAEGYTPAPDEHVLFEAVEVGPNYPQTIGMPIVSGRAIDLRDVDGAPPVAMINAALAERFFPGSDPVGHHLSLGQQEYLIVGVVKDALFHSARLAPVPFVFTPMLQEHTQMAMDCELEVRASGDTVALAAAIRDAVAQTDSRVTVMRAQTLRAQFLATLGPERLATRFVSGFAGLALLLAAIGVYGVVSYGVSGRTREIGVRLALGAANRDIIWLLLRETLVWLAAGLSVGAVSAAMAGRLIASQLFGVTAADPSSLVIAAATLAAVAVVASIVPAVRALRVHPSAALRAE